MNSFLSDPLQWAQFHFGATQLGDQRRTHRLVRLAAAMAADPAGTLPRLTETWADCKAAYRLFDCPDVTFHAVCQPHWDLRHHTGGGTFLLLDDTTELDFGKYRKAAGLGPLGNGSGNGLLLHSGLLYDPTQQQLLCLAGAVLLRRHRAPRNETATQRVRRPREIDRWGQLIDQIGPPPVGARWVHVMDREADNFEVFCHVLQQGCHCVIRARALTRRVHPGQDTTQSVPLRQYLAGLPVAAVRTLEVPAKARTRREKARPTRTAQLEVRYGQVLLPRPRPCSPYVKGQALAHIAVGVVWLREVNPPAGAEAVEWVLYTTLPLRTLADVWEVVGYYCRRWTIEEWHKALKTGTRIKSRQLGTADRLAPLIGLSAIEAVRLLQLRTESRRSPGRAAVEVVPVRYVRMLVAALQGRVAGGEGMTVREFFRGVARLGGFLGRKGDGEPGWQTLWHGWEKLALLIRGSETLHDPPNSQ